MDRRNKQKNKLVFVGLSGGVDSAVAAGLLKQRGYQVVGIFLKCWENQGNNGIGCGWERDEEDARQVAAKLAIPFYSWDFVKEYKKKVVDYLIAGYKSGITPNPDIECNREVKFGIFLRRALRMGADFVATGHYARLCCKAKDKKETIKNKEYRLLKGKDPNKDQSYFLWTLTQSQLKHTLFPVGEYLKPAVRKLAQKWGLPVYNKPDSQGICFMGRVDVQDFLRKHLKTTGGKIRTTEGKIIGEHDGLELYTIGQRKGIKVGGGIPYFVVDKDFATNELIVAKGRKAEALFQKELVASQLNWLSGKMPNLPFKCSAKIRYRQADQECNVREIKDKKEKSRKIKVVFKNKQRAVTSGQSVVFYTGDELIGGGIIQ